MLTFEIFPFNSRDGFSCNLWRLKSSNAITKEPVLLIHGAGVRSNVFNPPNQKNLLHILAEEGYDVWLENWRGSIDCEINEWDLDIVAKNDHPAAVEEVCRITNVSSIKAIIHCQGSTSFIISAILGLLPQVSMIISNAVSLHPIVPSFSKIKINYLLPVVKPLTNFLNPHWGDFPPDLKAKILRTFVNLTHWENDTNVGKFVSFTYGSGFPALWELNNLTEETKEWIRGEFGNVPISFFDHIKKCINANQLVSNNNNVHYASIKPKTDTRIAFFAGKLNKCFKSESQEKSWQYFNSIKSSYHSLHLIEEYSHLDIFFGKNALNDVFPLMIKELNQ